MENPPRGWGCGWKTLGVVVLGLLGSALLCPPHLGQSTRRVSCQANLQQLANALSLYAEDHDQTLPPVGRNTGYIPYQLSPYAKSRRLWQCITDSRPDSAFDGTPGDGTVSYGYNSLSLVDAGRGVRLSAVKQPAATVALVDSRSFRAAPSEIALPFGASPPIRRHQGAVNVVWLDGHARLIQLVELEERVGQEGGVKLRPGIESYRYWNRR